MTADQLIESLKKLYQENKVANDVFTSWSLRGRARTEITVSALKQRMDKEGFKHHRSEYATFLATLAKCGMGELEKNADGRVEALRNIKLSIPSVGSVAVGKEELIEAFSPRHGFKRIVSTTAVQTPEVVKGLSVSLSLPVGGRIVRIKIPSGISSAEIARLIDKFQDKKSA